VTAFSSDLSLDALQRSRCAANAPSVLVLLTGEDDMTNRVILWGPGEVGGTALRAILKRPEFTVVGCKVYSDSKDGVDIGILAGGDPIGVAATKSSDELIALHADCVVHTPMLPFDITDTDAEIIRLLESGKNVVPAVSYTAPEFFGNDYHAKFEDACQRGGVSFHGSGLYPGFVERLAVGLTGCVTEVNHVSIVEAADGLRALSPMVLQFAGWGQDPNVVAAGNAVTEVQKRFYCQSVAYIARRLFGLQPDQYRIDTTFRESRRPKPLSQARISPSNPARRYCCTTPTSAPLMTATNSSAATGTGASVPTTTHSTTALPADRTTASVSRHRTPISR